MCVCVFLIPLSFLVTLPLGQTTTTREYSISPDICATPSMPCPPCHLRDSGVCVFVEGG